MQQRTTDILAGLTIIVFCGATMFGATGYGIGSFSRMGAGFFPFSAAILGIALGLTVVFSSRNAQSDPGPSIVFRPVMLVAGAFLIFALTVDRIGIVPATTIAGTIAALADTRTRLWEAALLAVGTAGGIWLIFIVLLKLPITAFPGA